MLQPLFSEIPGAIETLECAADGRFERGRATAAAFSVLSGPLSLAKRSKARVRCTWKGCDHREPNTDEMKWVHFLAHLVAWFLNFVSGSMPRLTDAVLRRVAAGPTLTI